MSVPNQTPYIIYNANGLTTVFPFEFYIINAGDIQVSLNGAVITAGYSVSGVGNVGGGDVTFLTPPANGTVVMLERVVPTYRLTDYQDNGDLLADTVNKDFDRLWMAIQRSFIYLGLALRRPLFGGPYDAEGYRISNLADPADDQDAATKKWVLEKESANLNRALRVPENSVQPVPPLSERANKLLAFNEAGQPIAVLPPSGSASDVLIELAKPTGAGLVGFGPGHTVSDLVDAGIGNGDALIPVIQPFPNAGVISQHIKNAEHLSVADWLAVDGVDSSAQAQKMIDDTGMLIVPERFTLVAKNLNISSANKVIVKGKLKLPSGCVDFDRLLYAAGNNSGLSIYINELDGNKSGQSGQIGTHLVYLTNCQNVDFYAHYVHDHYYPRTFTTAPSPDGIRNDGVGCLFFYQCHYSKFIVDRIESWGHEAFYIYQTNRSIAALGHAQGATGDDGYSGIQFSGDYNRLLYASVDLASASGIGFDCRWSVAGKLISTNTQYFHGVNFGHAGLPTTGSVIESVYVMSCGQNGINFAAGSSNTKVLAAYVNAAGRSGINQSDGATGNTVNNATVVNSVLAQATSYQNNLILTNGNLATVTSALIPKLNPTSGGTFTVRNVRLSSTDSMEMKTFNGLGGVASATLTDGNITPYSHIVIYPANASAASANAYISSQTTGSLVLATQTGAPAAGGASFRYMVI